MDSRSENRRDSAPPRCKTCGGVIPAKRLQGTAGVVTCGVVCEDAQAMIMAIGIERRHRRPVRIRNNEPAPRCTVCNRKISESRRTVNPYLPTCGASCTRQIPPIALARILLEARGMAGVRSLLQWIEDNHRGATKCPRCGGHVATGWRTDKSKPEEEDHCLNCGWADIRPLETETETGGGESWAAKCE